MQMYQFLGNNELDIGTNIINIVVTAEDGTKGEYTVKVHRLSKTISEQNITPNIPSAAETSEENVTENSNEENSTNENLTNTEANELIDNEVDENEISDDINGVEITNVNAKDIKKNNNTPIIIIAVIAALLVLFAIFHKNKKHQGKH